MTLYEWITVGGTVVASSSAVFMYLIRRIEKIEVRVGDHAISHARLDEKFKALDEQLRVVNTKLDILLSHLPPISKR